MLFSSHQVIKIDRPHLIHVSFPSIETHLFWRHALHAFVEGLKTRQRPAMTSRAEALGGQVTTNKFKAGGCGSSEDVVAALRAHPSSAAVQGALCSRLGSHSPMTPDSATSPTVLHTDTTSTTHLASLLGGGRGPPGIRGHLTLPRHLPFLIPIPHLPPTWPASLAAGGARLGSEDT